jgi:hypothetical protein
MHQIKKIALLTGTINPRKFRTPFTKLLNKKERLNQYLNALKKYILYSDFDIIIFCENSRYAHDYSELGRLAKERGKILETIVFLGNKKEVLNRGKGYGEGEIIDYALRHSKHLEKPEQTFYKITGRIFVKNINKLLKKSNKEIYFFSVGKNHCVTLFFKCSVGFYRKNLFGAGKECDEFKGIHLENVFFNRLVKNKNLISRMSEYPLYEGISGTNSTPYKNGLKWFLRNLQLKWGFLDIR